MTFARLAIIALALSSTASYAAPADTGPCASLNALVRQSRNDFQSLKMRKFDSGNCTLRGPEFRCAWTFPGDNFAVAEAQSQRVAQCALAIPGVEGISGKRGETGFALESDLSMFVSDPELDMGDWQVRIRLVEQPPS